MKNDTIAAICSGVGGAISILRISGPEALSVASGIWKGKRELSAFPRKMLLGKFSGEEGKTLASDGEDCLAVYMPCPGSYTGEDVTEIHCHGGSFASSRLLRAALRAGARQAEPGEFTKRAFLNGKMDLTQAEAVADLIAAQSETAGRLAEHQMSGRLGKQVRECRTPLIHVLAELESRLDFPDEDLDWMPPEDLMRTIRLSLNGIHELLRTEKFGALVRDGLRIVLAGRPNVGKSSLLNQLLGYERAIVTDIPGTTRDTLEENASIRGIPVRLTDTAGIRDLPLDPVEKLGIARSKDSLLSAELILWILDASSPEDQKREILRMRDELPRAVPVIACWNKMDLLPPGATLPDLELPTAKISTLRSEGLEALCDLMEQTVHKNGERLESEIAVSARHSKLLSESAESLETALRETAELNWELAASCLHSAVCSLGAVTGENADPDILDEIFSRFCIGK